MGATASTIQLGATSAASAGDGAPPPSEAAEGASPASVARRGPCETLGEPAGAGPGGAGGGVFDGAAGSLKQPAIESTKGMSQSGRIPNA